MTTAELDDVLSPEYLAARWGVALGTLSNWRRAGKGPKFVRLGDGPRARVVYKLADVMNYEQEQQKK